MNREMFTKVVQQMQFYVIVFGLKQVNICSVRKKKSLLGHSEMKKTTTYHTALSSLRWVCCMLICMSFGISLQGQSWQKFYGTSNTDEGAVVVQAQDGGFLAVGFQNNGAEVLLLRTDANGNITFQKPINVPGSIANNQGRAILETDDGSILIAGTCSNCAPTGGETDLFILKTDPAGNVLWSSAFGNGLDDEAHSLIETNDGGFIIAGSTITSDNKQVFLAKVDEDGNEVWPEPKVYGRDGDDEAFDIVEKEDGNLLLCGRYDAGLNSNFTLIMEMSSEGDSLSAEYANGTFSVFLNSIKEKFVNGSPAGYVAVGQINSTGNNPELFFVNDGNTYTIGEDMLEEEGFDILQVSDGEFVIAGTRELSPTASRASFWRIDNNGVILTENTFTHCSSFSSTQPDFVFGKAESIIQTLDGGFLMVGTSSNENGIADQDVHLIKTDAQGGILTNEVTGKVTIQATGEPVEGALLQLVGNNNTYYATTDEDGVYSMTVDLDQYNMSLIRSNDYWTAGSPTLAVNILNPCDTTVRDFDVLVAQDCPSLEVDIVASELIPCETNQYVVTYCNKGTIEATDAYVEIRLDDALTYSGASINLTSVSAGLYRFNLDNVDIDQCGRFTLDAFLDCDATVGETHCVEAHIFPDSICTGSDPYEGPSIIVDGVCDNDSIRFEIRNQSDSDMDDGIQFIIIEDIIMLHQEEVELEALDSFEIAFEANGSTYRLMADQVVGHPGLSAPTVAIEGCTDGNPISLGFVTQFHEDDADKFKAIHCQESVDTPLPPGKRGYPKGYSDSLFIAANTDIKYQVHFQNEGIDTAMNLIIRDTISDFLDLTRFEPGASSHPYTWEVYGNGILEFTFENINLPGASTDPVSSRGFIQYRLFQKPDNAVGTEIYNAATSQFDFKAPSQTDSTLHRIGGLNWEDFIVVSTDYVFQPEVEQVHVYPNPFITQATFELASTQQYDEVTFQLFDATGRLLRLRQFSGNTFTFDRGDLSSGLYFYQLNHHGRRLAAGKVMIR